MAVSRKHPAPLPGFPLRPRLDSELSEALREQESKSTYQGCQGLQYWLAELDRYGNPTLIDGMHSRLSGAKEAERIIRGMRNGPARQFAYARIELDLSPDNPPIRSPSAINPQRQNRRETIPGSVCVSDSREGN